MLSISKIAVIIVVCFLFTHSVGAQIPIRKFDELLKVEWLKAGTYEVTSILSEFQIDKTDADKTYRTFQSKDLNITVHLTAGACGNDDIWQTDGHKIAAIDIELTDPIALSRINYDLTKWARYSLRSSDTAKGSYFLHNKQLGVAIKVFNDRAEMIYLFPPDPIKAKTCDNELGKSYSSGKWIESFVAQHSALIDTDRFPNVVSLELSNYLISKLAVERKVRVSTVGDDTDNDKIVYTYTVDAGNIIGNGTNVIWDLSGVKSGNYKITAGIDDGCGMCGRTITKELTVE